MVLQGKTCKAQADREADSRLLTYQYAYVATTPSHLSLCISYPLLSAHAICRCHAFPSGEIREQRGEK
jgi:hypothetical protein